LLSRTYAGLIKTRESKKEMSSQQTNQAPAGHLDAQLAELMEQVWASEAQWTVDDHIDAAIRYGRRAVSSHEHPS
jgi:hypothetical protein